MRFFSVYIEKMADFFTYSTEDESLKIGDRVVVSFRNKDRIGILLKEEEKKEYEFKVLEIKKKVEDGISFSKKFIDLILWVKDYYLSSVDQVFTAAIPSGIKIKYEDIYRVEKLNSLIENDEILNFFKERETFRKNSLVKRFGKEKVKILLDKKVFLEKNKWYLYNEESLFKDKEVESYINGKRSIKSRSLEDQFGKKILYNLVKRGLLKYERVIKEKGKKELQIVEKEVKKENVTLNEKQFEVKEKIENSSKKYFLLRGITGSGKTEVYISLIKSAVKNGEGAIFLVPEISLTPQIVKRFKVEFGSRVAVMHSKMTESERADEWYQIYSGEKKVVLGVRSAIFSPVKNLKYIIVDEEHENSYKQDTSPRYNAKYVAIKRGELENAKVILGSATPSIESYYYAEKGIFDLCEMTERYKDAKLPEVEIVDMKHENNSFFSEKLINEMRKALLRKEQIILLQNRKGYSTQIQCKSCGHIEECIHCSIKMSYYASQGVLKCNYCGISKKFSGRCSKCGSSDIEYGGKGIERVESELKKIFDVEILRVDGEAAKEKNFYERMYKEFLEGKYQIMLGTQMISRGLHFPNVTLVGVINSDLVMNIPDFRSGERTYQLITQVAGRAGRGDKEGKVIIQTYQPENYVIEEIKKANYVEFYKKEIEKREILMYPPFSKIINIGISSNEEKGLEEYAYLLLNKIKNDNVEVYGPMKSLVYKVKGRYRYNIFIKGEREKINSFKKDLKEKIKNIENKKYRVVIDIDPINLI